jgi:SAM-dependent MidA family methyltransferase
MNRLADQLREQIQRDGPLPFAEFMRMALYDPQLGYYAQAGQQIGRKGDFITSVSVGPFFGELLAFRFARWLEQIKAPVLRIVESGAHDGQLAHDVLSAIRNDESRLFANIEYWIVEPFASREQVQRERLASFENVRWAGRFSDIPGGVAGVIFSNELLDALPVHPFIWDAHAKRWHERAVDYTENRFAWTTVDASNTPPPELPKPLLDVLPDGYMVELCPDADASWGEAARTLKAGHLLTIDYGGTLEELLMPERAAGTLRAYARHRVSNDVLAEPGEQDITAHVNFTAIRRVGEAAGLRTTTYTNQSQFLTEIARELWTLRGSWPQTQVRQFQTLTHPEHLGRPFKVLVQSR